MFTSLYCIDIWKNNGSAKDAVTDVDLDEYAEYVFARKVLTKIDEMAETEVKIIHFYVLFLSFATLSCIITWGLC